MEQEIILVKAFTNNKDQGNPAGVVLNANGLTDEKMIAISAELGFSESAFVQASEKADFKVRFFTPTQEVNLCGHATIATFHTLLEAGIIKTQQKDVTKTQESKAGILPVTVQTDGLVTMTQPKPEYFDIVKERAQVADLLTLNPEDLVNDLPLQAVSTGSSKLMIPIKNRQLLFAIQPKLQKIADYCLQTSVRGLYPFTLDTIEKDSDFHARQFNPLLGINEDPITGVAAGALGAYAVKHQVLPKTTFVLEQGYVMNKAGKVFVEIGETVKVSGYAMTFGTKIINI